MTYTVFDSKYLDSEVKSSIELLEDLFQGLGKHDNEENAIDGEEADDEIYDITTDSQEDNLSPTENPFLNLMNEKLSDVYVCQESVHPLNPLYNCHWVVTLEGKWLPHIPFWTSLFRGRKNADTFL